MSNSAILILVSIMAVAAISGSSSTQDDGERLTGKGPLSSRPILADRTRSARPASQLTTSRHWKQALFS